MLGRPSRAPAHSVGPRLHLVNGRSDQILYLLPEPDPAGRTALRLSALEFLDRLATIPPPPRPPDTAPSRPSRWAALLARIYEAFPLICPTCQIPLTFIVFLTDPEPITQILAHIGEPTSPR